MRTTPLTQFAAHRNRAFTMIEIAISLAIIGFALVAVIGVLPTGLTAQKENREETIINQDGPYFLEVIRNGSQGLEHLTQYVDSITIISTNPGVVRTLVYTNNGTEYAVAGSNIVGLLSHPTGDRYGNIQKVVAQVRALSGAAVETGGASQDFAFAYQLTTEIVPFISDTNAMRAVINPALDTETYLKSFTNSFYEVRVTCQWPLLPNGGVGRNRKTFRSLIAGKMNEDHKPRYFFESHSYKKQP